MSEDREIQPHEFVIALIGMLILFIIGVSFSGCSPKIIEKIKTEYVYKTQHDTSYVHDSTYISVYEKGDTVRITEYRDRYIYKYRSLRDTVAVHDTSYVQLPAETITVEKELSWWKKMKIDSFWWIVGALVLSLLWIFRKPIIKLIKIIIP